MAGPGVVLGERLGPFPGRLTPELIRRYVEATQDPNADVLGGEVIRPVASVTQIWQAQQAGFATFVPEEVRGSMTGGVHGGHDVVLHRPIVPGEELRTWVEGHGSRRGGNQNLVTLHYATTTTTTLLSPSSGGRRCSVIASLHNGELGGGYFYATEGAPIDYYERLGDLCRTHSIPLHLGDPETPFRPGSRRPSSRSPSRSRSTTLWSRPELTQPRS